MPSRPPASLRNCVAVRWPRPREPKCTPIQTKPCLILEQIDIVVAGPPRAELFRLERSKSNQLARERLARVGGRGGIEARAS